MPQTPPKLTVWEEISLTLVVLQIPIVVLYSAITSPWAKTAKGKTTARAIFDSTARFVTSKMSIRQLQKISGSSYSKYEKWLKDTKVPPHIDDLGHESRLFWLGPKKTDKILLYCHGGGFIGPVSDFNLTLWDRVQKDIVNRPKGQEISIVVLEYSLNPIGFPTQLEQLILGINHLFSVGVKPQNLQLAGDSAGGNLILQLLSHTLHPLPDIAPSPLSVDKPAIRGVCLISPWVEFSGTSPSHKKNDPLDLVSTRCLQEWGAAYASSLQESQLPYAQAALAPKAWWNGIDKIVDRVLITAGGNELLLDDIVQVAQNIETAHPSTSLDVQAGGVHVDPLFDYAANTKQISKAMERIVDWLAEGFSEK